VSQASPTATPIASNPPNVRVDRYGGRIDISCTTNPGKWHTEKINGRWLVCTPANHGFFKVSLFETIVPRGLNINAKYGNSTNYVNAQLARFQAWGFNTIDVEANTNLWATHSPAILMPFAIKIFASKHAAGATGPSGNGFSDNNGHAAINYVVQNIWAAMPGPFYQFTPYLPLQADPSDAGIATDAFAQVQGTPAPNPDYIIETYVDDGGDTWGLASGYGGDNDCANPSHPHLGWVSLASSPVQNAGSELPYNTTNHQYLSYNPTHVSKAGLEAFLKNRYNNSISALNTAWGSSYTQFDSMGTQITGETMAAGDGRTAAYTRTLTNATPSRYSIGITVGGTLVAGDLAHDNGDGSANASNTTDGRIWGPYVTGTITYGTKGLSVTFSTTANQHAVGALTIKSISLSSNVVTVQTGAQHGLWTGAYVDIAGTTNYNGTNIGPITVVDSITFRYAKVASLATETSGTFALHSLPGGGSDTTTIKVNYIYNGWEIGTGLMDEADNHSWSNGDQYACKINTLSAQMQTDLNDYLGQIATIYFSGLRTVMTTQYSTAMYAGFDATPGVAKTAVMKAMGQYLDVIPTAYFQLSQSQLDAWYATAGDRPLYTTSYSTATLDSPNAPPPDNGPPGYYTQEVKGQAYYSQMQTALNATYTASGTHPFVGFGNWSYYDMNDGNGYRFGLVTPKDNAYDGHEDVAGSVTCSAPLQAYTCGGESYTTPSWQGSHTYGYGSNVIGSVSGTSYIFTKLSGGNSTSGGSQPNWSSSCPNPGNTCSDGSVTWTNEGVWTKAANPSDMGNAITPTGGGVQAGNALWLSVSP
jgi:hypothetical protein